MFTHVLAMLPNLLYQMIADFDIFLLLNLVIFHYVMILFNCF